MADSIRPRRRCLVGEALEQIWIEEMLPGIESRYHQDDHGARRAMKRTSRHRWQQVRGVSDWLRCPECLLRMAWREVGPRGGVRQVVRRYGETEWQVVKRVPPCWPADLADAQKDVEEIRRNGAI